MKKILTTLVALGAIALVGTGSAFAQSTTTTMDFGSSLIAKGSSNSTVVKNIQTCLNVSPVSGKFGNLTEAAVKKFQKENGIMQTGKVGSVTRPALVTKCGTMAGASTTPVAGTPATSTTMSGTEGNLSNVVKLGTYNNTKANEGSKDTMIYSAEVTARNADQKVDGITVIFKNNKISGNSSLRFTRLASDVSIWLDGKEIGRKAAADFTNDSGDNYEYQFTGMSGIVKKDMKGQIVVAVSTNSTLDTTDVTGDIWNVWATEVSAVSPNGRYRDTSVALVGGSPAMATIDFQKATGEATFKATTNSTNPVARTVQTSKTAPTNNVTLLTFDMKAENAAMLLQRLPVTVTVAGAGVTSAQTVVSNVKLFVDGTEVTSESAPTGTTGTVTFGNTSKLAKAIAANTIAKVEIKANLNARGVTAVYPEGTTVMASYVGNANVELDNTNRDTVTNMTGTVTGELQTLRTTGALVTMGSTTTVFTPMAATGASSNRATYTIPVTVKAFDDTVYVGQSVVAGPIGSTHAFSYVLNESGAPTVGHTTPAAAGASSSSATTTISSSATVEGTAWRVDAGSEKTFNIQVIVSGSTAAKNIRVQLNDFQFFTNAALTTGATTQVLAPTSAFQTSYSQVY